MKAKIHDIELEGTPEQIAEVIRLAGFAKEVREVIRYVPTWIPQPQPYKPWWEQTWITYDGATGTGTVSTSSGQCSVTLTAYNGENPDATGTLVPAN